MLQKSTRGLLRSHLHVSRARKQKNRRVEVQTYSLACAWNSHLHCINRGLEIVRTYADSTTKLLNLCQRVQLLCIYRFHDYLNAQFLLIQIYLGCIHIYLKSRQTQILIYNIKFHLKMKEQDVRVQVHPLLLVVSWPIYLLHFCQELFSFRCPLARTCACQDVISNTQLSLNNINSLGYVSLSHFYVYFSICLSQTIFW